MAHLRNQIRDAMVTRLTNLTTTGTNVFRSRIYPLESNNLPGLCIFTKSEVTTFDTLTRPRSINRVLEIGVEAYVKATSNYDNTLDTIAVEVEEAIAADRTLGGLAKDTYLESTEIEFNAEGEKPLGYVSMTFLTNYYVKEKNPDVAL